MARCQIRVSSMSQELGDQNFTFLAGCYLQRGESMVHRIGIGAEFQQVGGQAFYSPASLLVTAFIGEEQMPQGGFVTSERGIGIGSFGESLQSGFFIHALHRPQ